MRNRKGNEGYMAIKVAIKDRLKWEFIKNTLEDIRLPLDMINII